MKKIFVLIAILCTTIIMYAQHQTFPHVVITEIMADPTPLVGLPDFEYVEIYNVSSDTIKCSDLQLIVGTKSYALPQGNLYPQEFLCVISNKAQTYFSDSLHFAYLKTFPAITNSGQTIGILYKDVLISSVTFSEDWYHDDFKQDGGWSLEKIDVENFSETPDNWNSSKNRSGGTPGFINSVAQENSDFIAPTIASIQIVSDSVLQITFSENIDIEQFMQNCNIDDTLTFCNATTIDNSMSKYELLLNNPLEEKPKYVLSLREDCTDLAGNPFEPNQYIFAKTDSLLQRNAVVINEVLFNPLSGNASFVELYNNSNSYFDLSQMYFSNGSTFTRIAENFTLFPPQTYVVVSPDADLYRGKCDCEKAIFLNAKLPTLPNDEGTIMLLNRWEEVIDSVTYNENWHSANVEPDGTSIERVSFILPSFEASAWASATASVGFSTPGCQNSQAQELFFQKGISLESEVVTPNGDGENDELCVLIENEEYRLYCNIRIFSISGHFVKQIADTELMGGENFIRWDCTNAQGQIVPKGIYLVHIEIVKDGEIVKRNNLTVSVLKTDS
ncbi:MAG: lamin tail domain-containing protein [Bacteroidales bacterium]|nr:lamin tail domain-containing protein [Bacteroidales bacterium]